MVRPPNIVIFHCDSMDGRVMGCMGHPAAHTPNLDRLADEGVLFRNTYSNNPICCPSRASMFSGQFTHHCEGWNNYKGLEEGSPTFLTHLGDHGYTTQTFGKTDYLSGRHTNRARVTAWLRSARIMLPTYVQPAPGVIEPAEPQSGAGGAGRWSSRAGDWRIVESSARWLTEQAGGDTPFLLYCGVNGPHPAFKTTQYWMDKIPADKVSIPAHDGSPHSVMEYMRVAKNWEHGLDDPTVRLVRQIYFAMIADVDAMAGYLRSVVDELGLTDNTYFIFASDHGEMAMEHQQYYKMCHYEPSARVPLIVAGPDARAGHAVDDLASLVDLYPTLVDLVGQPMPAGLDGESLAAEISGRRGRRRDWVLSECHDSTSCTGAFMLRRRQWKYVAYPGAEPMLFDLEEDAGELVNLAADRPEVLAEYDAALGKVVDYQAVDAKVKQYDRSSFAAWRHEHQAAGTYRSEMGRIHRGYRQPQPDDATFWDDQKEQLVEDWLEQ